MQNRKRRRDEGIGREHDLVPRTHSESTKRDGQCVQPIRNGKTASFSTQEARERSLEFSDFGAEDERGSIEEIAKAREDACSKRSMDPRQVIEWNSSQKNDPLP
jgi:hypothetical protein